MGKRFLLRNLQNIYKAKFNLCLVNCARGSVGRALSYNGKREGVGSIPGRSTFFSFTFPFFFLVSYWIFLCCSFYIYFASAQHSFQSIFNSFWVFGEWDYHFGHCALTLRIPKNCHLKMQQNSNFLKSGAKLCFWPPPDFRSSRRPWFKVLPFCE